MTCPASWLQGLPRHRYPCCKRSPIRAHLPPELSPPLPPVAVLLPLSACGSGSDGSGSTDASGKVEGDITFQTWNLRANFKPYFEGVIADFEKKYPAPHVKWVEPPAEGYADKISADAAGGTLPDVVNVSPEPRRPARPGGPRPRPRQVRRAVQRSTWTAPRPATRYRA